MERLDPYDASQLPDGDMDHTVVDHARPQSPGIDHFVHIFLDNIKTRFGEHAIEVTTILSVLGTFRRGNISKREAVSSITLTLRNQEDLKQDLMNVLYHKDAKWSAGDFDLDQPVMHPYPQFLQPAHEPQLRLPPISSSWYLGHRDAQSINPAVLSGYSGSVNFGHQEYGEPIYTQRGNRIWQPIAPMPSSPMLQSPTNYHLLDQFTSQALDRSARFSSYTSASYDVGSGSVSQESSSNPHCHQIQDSWGNINYGKGCTIINSLQEEVLEDAGPYVLGNPLAVPIGRPAIDMPPPSRKGSRRGPVSHVQAEQQHREDITGDQSRSTSPSTVATRAQVPERHKGRRSSTVKSAQPRSEGGPFIHSLCGKGFASRSGVKKHHWGAKNDDLETKTGCWAKYKKPNVSWNEHPSCREQPPAPRVVKKTSSQSISKPEESRYKAPVVPVMIPSLPTLEDLPQTVAEALAPTHDSFENVGSYHPHRLPARSSFDSLLTAVNLASWIDAPKPQGRNDSVVSHLNAQALAAERHREYIPAWIEASRGHGDDGLTYDPFPDFNHSNGKMEGSPSMDILTQMGEDGYNSSSVSPTDTT